LKIGGKMEFLNLTLEDIEALSESKDSILLEITRNAPEVLPDYLSIFRAEDDYPQPLSFE
jgi:hypothetical protein